MGPLREWVRWGVAGGAGPVACCSDRVAVGAGSRVSVYSREASGSYGQSRWLQAGGSSAPFTSLALVSSVDYMLAAGDSEGRVTIFQIPKPHSRDIPNSIRPKEAQIERYTVGGLHKSEITHLEWSKNGMKLFSGDKDGVVVLTEIDFYMHICKSSEIINESYEIVQLSYFQNNLLISSVYRCIICHYKDEKWTVNQVGKKDRKNLCKLGGIFHYDYNKPNDLNIYSARPGLRLWMSDKEGNVIKTLLFKEAVLNPTRQVELLNPVYNEMPTKDLNFGQLHIFNNKYLVTHNEDVLYILDPVELVAIATIDNLKRIISVATNNDEIFIVDGDRNIIRIAYHPDHPDDLPKFTNETLMTRSLLNPLELAINTIKKLTVNQNNPKCNSSFDLESPITISTDCTSVVNADECFELPPVVKLSQEFEDNSILEPIIDIKLNDDNQDTSNVINEINVFSDVTNKNQIPQSTKKRKISKIVNISSKWDEEVIQSTSTLKKNMIESETTNINYYSDSCMLPGYPSSESLEEEIRAKEERLAKILDLEPINKIVSPAEKYNDVDDNYDNFSQMNKFSETKVKPKTKDLPRIVPLSEITPDCVSIPNVWNLKKINITPANEYNFSHQNKSKNTKFYDDWELV